MKDVYLSGLEWTKTHGDMGGVMGNVVFKDSMAYEDYEKLLKSGYFVLCNKDYITNLQQENKEWEMIFDTFSSRPYAHRYLEEKRKELGNKRIIGLDSEMIYKEYYYLKQIEQDHKETNATLMSELAKLKEENEFLKLSNPEMNIEHFRIINENKRKIDNLRKQNKELQQENERLKENLQQEKKDFKEANDYCFELKDYKSRCEKASDKIQYIINYGFDYDGFNTVESLKGLIDMLVDYARESKNILQNGSDE